MLDERTYEDSFLCLNPVCQFKQMRVLNKQNKQNHHQCSQWFLSKSEIQANKKINPQKQPNLNKVKNFNTDFLFKPILSLRKCFQMKHSKVKQALENLFQLSFSNILDILKQKLQQQLKSTYQQMCDIIEAGNQVWQDIQRIINENTLQQLSTQKALNSPSFLEKLKTIESFGKVCFLNEKTATEKMVKTIQDLQTISQGYLFREKQQQVQQRKKEIYSYKQVTQFLSIQKLGVVNKLQRLAAIFGAPQPQFQLNQKDQSTFDQLQNQYSIFQIPKIQIPARNQLSCESKCWICQDMIGISSFDQKVSSKQKKRLAADKLLQHLMSSHWKVVQYQILTKKMKVTTFKVSFQLFLFEIHNLQQLYERKGEKKFIVIDRQNAGKFQLSPHQLDQFYTIEVMNEANEHLARGKYMVAQSKGKDAADLLSVLLLYQIAKVKHSTSYLITNDHYGITLKQILQPLGVNIICHGSEFIDYRMPKNKGNTFKAGQLRNP